MRLLPPSCAFGSALAWAVASVRYSDISREYSVFTLNFMRALIALPLFIVAVFTVSGGFSQGILSYQCLHLFNLKWLGLSIVASFGLGDAVFLLSAQYLGVPSALAISSAYPIWTLIWGAVYLGERITPVQYSGAGVTLLGLLVVVLSQSKRPSLRGAEPSLFVGMGLAVLASLLWSLNGMAVSRGELGIISPVGNSIRMVFALVMTAGLGRLFYPASPLILPTAIIRKFFWIFILESFIGTYLYVYGISNMPLAIGVILSSLAPVVSVPFAVLFGLEKFSVSRTLGVCLAVGGVALLVRA